VGEIQVSGNGTSDGSYKSRSFTVDEVYANEVAQIKISSDEYLPRNTLIKFHDKGTTLIVNDQQFDLNRLPNNW
jgi:hypothetical protein